MTMLLVFIAACLFLAAVILILRVRAQRRFGGLPAGDLIYIDDVARDCPVFVSHRYGLKGKPDALVRTESGHLIPVERKKTRAPRSRPYDGDLIQATAYCVLVEEEFGQAPPVMRIQYADRWFDEPYTRERKEWVLETCQRVRQARRQPDCRRSHRIAGKCRNCGQKANCGDRLTAATRHYLNSVADSDGMREHSRFFVKHLSIMTARPEQVQGIRQTVLDLAVRGKLVEQNAMEVPAPTFDIGLG